ncbi:MAG TPA: amidohydrolase family protein [Pseudonocardiaceae bacterium]|jgi:2,3-dihydroxybenzoate decarboxylase|nr:amidohydrolase family protein [Pseudonocardiaceae bacterium]
MAIRQLPVVGRPATAPTPLRKIAIEEHFVDPEQVHPHFGDGFSAEFDQDGSSYGGFNPEFAETVTARLNDLRAGRIDEMDAAGIDVAILSHTIGGVEGIADPVEAVGTARRVNDFLAAEVTASGGRFAGFATIALQDVDAAVRELKRAVTELGLVGVMVNGYTNLGTDRLYLDEDRFDPFFSTLEELRVPLYLHPRLPARAVQDAIYQGHPELVGATWGFAPETATHVLRMVYGGVFDRHPQANLIIGHLGETLPYFAGRIQRAFEYNPYSWRPRKRLQDYLSDNIWLTTSGNFNDQALITALLTVGADHIMFASDYPYDMATDAARWIESAPISENDRRKICHGNAAALFGLGR